MSTPTEPNARITRCPSCGKSSRYDLTNEFRPFCCSRCKTQDIAAWAEESFRIPAVTNIDEEGDGEAAIEDDDFDRY